CPPDRPHRSHSGGDPRRGRPRDHLPTDVTRAEDLLGLLPPLSPYAVGQRARLSNAGTAPISPVADLDAEGWEAMIDVKLGGGCCTGWPRYSQSSASRAVATCLHRRLDDRPHDGRLRRHQNAGRILLEGLRQE